MEFGDIWMALGIDVSVLQGAVTHLYREDPGFQVVEGPGYRLELVIPLIEVRPACGPKPYRMGIRLIGTLTLEGDPNPFHFDAFVRLDPVVLTDGAIPAGGLSFVEVEDVVPAFTRASLEAEFAPDGKIGKVLSARRLDLFGAMLDAATRILHPPPDPEDPVDIDPGEFAVDFWLGQPAPMRRPVYAVDGEEPLLEWDIGEMTVPSLMATVALAGTSPRTTGDPSVCRPGHGMTLVTAKAALDVKLDNQAAATIGDEINDAEITALTLEGVDAGIAVTGSAEKTGGSATFEGTMVCRYQGGTDGVLRMDPAIHTDVHVDDWVIVLSVFGIMFAPLFGLILVNGFVWIPASATPDRVSAALREAFTEPLTDAAEEIAAGFGVDNMPSAAYLSDVWFFDGNLAVAAVALLGNTFTEVKSVSYDTAMIGPKPENAPHGTIRRREVKSIRDITLATGQTVTPWQAGELVRDGLITLPGYHAVHQPKAKGEWYLRSNPNDTLDDNLIR